jgi:hypothetical protein
MSNFCLLLHTKLLHAILNTGRHSKFWNSLLILDFLVKESYVSRSIYFIDYMLLIIVGTSIVIPMTTT